MKRRKLLQAAVAIPFANLIPPALSGLIAGETAPTPFGFGGANASLVFKSFEG